MGHPSRCVTFFTGKRTNEHGCRRGEQFIENLHRLTSKRRSNVPEPESTERQGEITELILKIDAGVESAREELCNLVYDELKQVARGLLKRGNYESLDSTDVVHNLFEKMFRKGQLGDLKNRRYFYTTATDLMRKLLIDHWRHGQTKAAGGHLKRNDLDMLLDQLVNSVETRSGGDVEALNTQLVLLQQERPRQFEVVQLRFYGGLTIEQTAEVLEVSVDTVKRDWKLARAKLHARLVVD